MHIHYIDFKRYFVFASMSEFYGINVTVPLLVITRFDNVVQTELVSYTATTMFTATMEYSISY